MCYGNIFERNYSGNYIPDLTERYPEGFRTFDEPYDCGYEPTYEELVADGEIVLDEEEIIMKDMNFTQLNKELINRGIVFEPHPTDEYETSCELEAIYSWGFTTITYCIVVDPVITFYDWEGQSILCLNKDEYTQYKINNDVIFVSIKYTFYDEMKSFVYDLKNGAPVHINDIAAIGYKPSDDYHDKRFYKLKDGRIYYKEDGCDLKLLEGDVDVMDLDQEFELIGPDSYQSNINVLNNMIVRM